MIHGELDDELRSYVRGISRSLARGDRHLAEDLEQETFVAALQSRPRDPQAVRAWLRAITKNCLRNIRSKTARRPRSVAFTTGVHDSDGNRNRLSNDPHQLTSQAELQGALERAIDRLPPAYSQVISMRIVDGMPPRVIAETLGIPVETVRTRTRRGFERLKVEVEKLSVDPRVLEDPRPLFGLAAFLRPGKRAAVFGAIAIPAAVIIGMQLAGAKSEPAPNAQSAASVGRDEPDSPALASVAPGDRSTTLAAKALAQVRFTLESTGGPPTVAFTFEPADGSRSTTPFSAEVAKGETIALEDLEPGFWRLRHNGDTIEERELLPGTQDWRVSFAQPRALEIVALGAGGIPADGVSIYTRNGFFGEPKLAGITDPLGRLSFDAQASDRWIAARGAPGESSKAYLVDQPQIEASGQLELHLETWPVHWLGIDHGPELQGADFKVNCEPDDLRDLCLLDMAGGISGSSCWLPAWVDGEGRFGIVAGDVRKFACVTVDGVGIWTSGLITRFGTPPSHLLVSPSWTVTGRLLTSDGLPFADRPVRIITAGRTRMSGKEIRTDADGRFVIERLTAEAIEIHSNGCRVAKVERPKSGAAQLGDLFHPASSRRITLSGQVTGIEAPFTIHGLTLDDARQPVAMELASDGARRFMVIRNGEGAFDLQAGPDRTLGIVISPADGGPTFPPTFFPRPAEGWPAGALSLHVDSSRPVAQIEGTVDAALLPARVQFRHTKTGYRRCVELPGSGASSGASSGVSSGVSSEVTFVSPPLSPGTWVVSMQGRDGRFADCERISLGAGENCQLGLITRKLGQLRLRWPAERSAGEGSLGRAFIVLMEGNEVIHRDFATREFIESPRGILELPAGSYSVTMAIGQEIFLSRAVVGSGTSVETTPKSGRITLAVQLPQMDMVARDVEVQLDVRGPDGRQLDAVVIPREQLAAASLVRLVADRNFPMQIRCSYGGRVIETRVTRAMGMGSRLRVNLAEARNGSD